MEVEAEDLRRRFFSQPLHSVLEVIDGAFRTTSLSASHRVVILGDPGSGKSSLVRCLALRWARIADPQARDAVPVPLVIELGRYGRWQCVGQKGLVRFLEEGQVWHTWPAGVLQRLLDQSGRAILLLDGLDEIFDAKTREDVVNDIQRFINQQAQTPVVITSRVVGYQSQRLRDAEFRHFMLQDLNAAQIDAFIDRWHEETFESAEQAAPKRERLKKGIRDSKSIAMFARNPLLLTMMAILNRNQKLPRDRVELYAQASRLLMHQWDTERALADFPGLSKEIGRREKNEILRKIASFMQSGPDGLKGNIIAGERLEGLIEDYLCNDRRFAQAGAAAARAVVEHLRQRSFILCFVGADSYSFVHRTFLEYFCAADVVHQFNTAKTLDEKGLIALFVDHCCDDDWREVLRLICGQIDEKHVGLIVERLATHTNLEQWDGDTPLPELPLAIWCLSECRNPEQIAAAGGQLLRQVAGVFRAAGFSPAIHSFFVGDLHNASRELGPRWPGRDELLGSVVPVRNESRRSLGPSCWPGFVANVMASSDLVLQLCVCDDPLIRLPAIRALAGRWPDEATRELLCKHAVQDGDGSVRAAALELLAQTWPDETTRTLLTTRAVQDNDRSVQRVALQRSAETWPDDATRELLTQRAVQDHDVSSRHVALHLLAKTWPDETTRALLIDRAVQDQDGFVRGIALRFLTVTCPHERPRKLLIERAVNDPNRGTRCIAASIVGETHSQFGRLLFFESFEPKPYLDPHNPLPREHIEKCAAMVNLPPYELEKTLAELSLLLGWDVRVGARPEAAATGRADA